MHSTTIRAAALPDLDVLVTLLGELFSMEADFTPDPERQRRGLALLLEGHRNRHVVVAERGGRVVGMATVQVLVSTAEGSPVGLVEDVVVAREARGTGVGRALLSALVEWSAERGLARLQLLADRDNAPALAFYDREGWRETRLVCRRLAPLRF